MLITADGLQLGNQFYNLLRCQYKLSGKISYVLNSMLSLYYDQF